MVLSVVCMSCAGGNVSQNGLFENDHRELKESLVGVWGLANAGEEIYEFYKEGKEVKLRVMGVETEMAHFDSPDGLTFSFEYKKGSGNATFVLGQFKSYQRQGLLAIEDSPVSQKAGPMLNLEKRIKTVVVVTEDDGSSE